MIEDDKHASNKKKNRLRQINKLQSILKIKFRNKSLLNRALTHRSYLNEAGPGARDNERLEYLGDSVLALVVNEYLFKRFEKYPEGDLAKIKSAVVSEATLFKVARELNLGSFLLMGRGEDLSGGRARPSILANTLEAVIGALYLDSGLKDCKKLVLSLLKGDIERIDSMESYRDPKTTLQEYVQKKYRERPLYEIIEESGPDHQKRFTVRLVVAGKSVAGVLVEEGKLLLIAHKKKKNIYWLLPGGGVDYGESLCDALKRELREELSIEAEVHDIAFICDSIGPGLERHIVNICFYCTRVNGDLSLGNEKRLHDYSFFDLDGLDDITIFPPIREELKRALGGAGGGPIYIGKRWMEL